MHRQRNVKGVLWFVKVAVTMERMLRARLFGPLTVEVDGRSVPDIAGLKPRSVLAWLLLHPGPHSRVRVASLFWPDVLDISARASLRNALWGIRAALDAAGGSAYLEAGRDSVAISADLPRDVDTEEFDRLAEQGDAASLSEALAVVQAPLLTDLADDWVLDAREAFRERAATSALRLADLCEREGDLRGAVLWTRRAITHVPVRESAYRMLMRRLAASGERGEALAAFDRCRAVLTAEFGTGPSESTLAMAGRLRAGEQERSRVLEHEQRFPQTRTSRKHSDPGTLTPPLIGRGHELRTLTTAWEEARQGRGGVVLVSGAAGLGKSRLVAELCRQAAGQDSRCAAGAAFELDGAPPYALWTELLPELLAEVSAPPRDAAWPADLARLCRSVEWRWGRPAARPSPDPEQERRWLFEAVVETVAWCAAERPLLLLLEDIHLADPASIALLAYAGRRLTRLPVLLVATRRPAVARGELAITVDVLARRDALMAEIELAPLPPAELDAIVRSSLPDLDVQARAHVVDVADGNPLFARRAALAAAGGADPSAQLRDWVRAPLARLPGPAKLLVDGVAVLGRPMDTGEAAHLVGAQELASALEHACREELLATEGRRVQFVHALVRKACHAEIDPSRQAWLNGLLADMLDCRPERPVTEIARHLLGAGQWERAQRYLITAAEKARTLGALDDAADLYSEAATLETGTTALRAELWLALADINAWRGRKVEHDAVFDQARELYEQTGDRGALASAFALRGRCLRTTLCYPREALLAYERAFELIDTEGLDTPELRAIVLAGLGWIEVASGDVARGEALLDEATALPEATDDPGLAAELGVAKAAALLRRGRPADSEQECETAATLAQRAGLPELASVSLLQAASACASQGAFERAIAFADRVRRARPSISMTSQALAARAYALARLGRHAAAGEAAQEHITVVTKVGDAEQEANAKFDAASIAMESGRYREAANRFGAVLAETAGQYPRALARVRLAEALVRAGDLDAAARHLEWVPFEPIGPTDLPETLVPRVELVEALMAAARGELAPALRRLSSAEAAWRRMLCADGAPVDPFAASLVDFGRPPVGGQVEPGVELGRVLAERAGLLARSDREDEARAAADEAARLADTLRFNGYLSALRSVPASTGG